MQLLAISGSLRKASLNTAALEAAVRLAPAGLDVSLYRNLRDLPLYDYDFDTDFPPTPVRHLRSAVAACDALLVASPEYAHGITGPMKNALDWLVGDTAFPGKPIAIWNISPRAVHAQAHLREVLETMSARVVEEASITLPLLGREWAVETITLTPDLSAGIRQALHALAVVVASMA